MTTLELCMLRGSVQRAVFCPACDAVLDVRRAVDLTVTHEGTVLHSTVLCGKCYDERAPFLGARLAKAAGHPVTVEIVDGRDHDNDAHALAGAMGGF